jgi:26S proteasome regulatory subunit N7
LDWIPLASILYSHYGYVLFCLPLFPQAQKLATEGGGGDWDRRNRLKVYLALSKLLARDIKGAAGLFIDCIATFSCNEICSYQSFIVYSVMSNVLHLPRPELKEKILDGPEILSVATEIPIVVRFDILIVWAWQLD